MVVLMLALRYSYPRGLRNHNPGNIRHVDGNQWNGQTGDDGSFVIFSEPAYGVRALSKVLNSYYYRHGLHTIAAMINRYAPAIENNTSSYIDHVAGAVGIGSGDFLGAGQFEMLKPKIIEAIIKHENGQQPYSVAQLVEWTALA